MSNTLGTTGKQIHLRDGRALGYAEFGDPAGRPVFFFHGFPGSRLQRYPDDAIAIASGVRIITIDRPGFGLSSFQPGRKLLDWPADVAQLAGALGIDRFAAIGLSGGGPYLLACAYKIPGYLTSATVVSCLSPLGQPGVTRGMDLSDRIVYSIARRAPWWLMRFALGPVVRKVQRDPAGASKRLPRSAPQADKDVFARPSVQAMDYEDLIESYRSGVDGVSWEAMVLTRPWGFRLEDIHMKIYLWQGEADRTVPVSMAKYLARTLPECEARFIPGEGHMLMFNYWREILAVS
ncbi:MAG TPA: alpha/beta hydrolase [Ktedonobacteraceae bacterium]|nr:alpha/beta hydrolase [Ktedonobacteraceae bacterium]